MMVLQLMVINDLYSCLLKNEGARPTVDAWDTKRRGISAFCYGVFINHLKSHGSYLVSETIHVTNTERDNNICA